MDREIRRFIVTDIETRAENEANIITGYVAKFNSLSQYLGFYETISPDAFNKTLADGHNIFALYNHDYDKLLGSTATNTLQLNVDNVGLRFTLSINSNISYAKDTYELVKSGQIQGCSFGFICNNDSWSLQEDGSDLRTLLDVQLLEITLTPYPAYTSTEATCRSYNEYKDKVENEKKAAEQRAARELKQKQIKIELDLLEL